MAFKILGASMHQQDRGSIGTLLETEAEAEAPWFEAEAVKIAAPRCCLEARQCPEAPQHFRTQLTIAITDSATTELWKWGYKRILRAKRAKNFFGLYPQLWVHFGGTLVANEVKKIFKWICLGTRRHFGGKLSPVPLPGYVTGLSIIL